MSDDDTLTPEQAVANLRAAIEDWWRIVADDTPSVMRAWYLIGVGKAWDDDGDDVSHIYQRWEGDVIDQLGMAAYMTAAVDRRAGGGRR